MEPNTNLYYNVYKITIKPNPITLKTHWKKTNHNETKFKNNEQQLIKYVKLISVSIKFVIIKYENSPQ